MTGNSKGNTAPTGADEHAATTAPLDAAEQATLRAAITARGVRSVASAIGLTSDAVAAAGAGAKTRRGTNATIRAWLHREARE